MSGGWRERLRGRFRAEGADRLKVVDGLLREQGDDEAGGRARALRELHTLKGEARMLGFARLNELAHAVEGALESSGAEGARLSLEAVGLMLRVLRDDVPADEADAALVEATRRLALGLAEAPAAQPPRAPSAPAPPSAGPRPAPRAERWVRVRARDVDQLCAALADLDRSHRLMASRARAAADRRSLLESCDRAAADLEAVSEAAWAFRMIPLEPLLEDACRHARQLAESQGKRLRTAIRCGATEVDREVLEGLSEPLLHLVRNAVDHGVESPEARGAKPPEAAIEIDAEAGGAMVVIHVSDDGRGIDAAAVRTAAVTQGLISMEAAAAMPDGDAVDLVFRHGFSTCASVTELSGRGVGLHIVRDVAESLGGGVAVRTELGRGTRFTIEVPASVGKESALVVACGGHLYALPGPSVLEVLRASQVERADDGAGPAITWRAERVPLCSLSATLGEAAASSSRWVVVVAGPSSRCALAVPEVLGELALLRRPVDALAALGGFVTASAVLDDGRLVLVLSVGGLIRRARPDADPIEAPRGAVPVRVLLVDDSAVVLDLVQGILRASGLAVETAGDAATALERVAAERPDVVVTDVEMPGMDGFELLAELRRREPDLPVIMLSARAGADSRSRAMELGARAYLVKSEFPESRLIETVRAVARVAA